MSRFLLKEQGRDDMLVQAKDYSFLYFNLYILDYVKKNRTLSFRRKLDFVKIVKNNLYEFIDYRTHTIAEVQEATIKNMVLEISREMGSIIKSVEDYLCKKIETPAYTETRHVKKRDLNNYMDHEFIQTEYIKDELAKDETNQPIHLYPYDKEGVIDPKEIADPYAYYVDASFFKKLDTIKKGIPEEHHLIEEFHEPNKIFNRLYCTEDYHIRLIHDQIIKYMTQSKEIFMTIYRIESNSRLIAALVDAGRMGIDVTVYVELSARGNELDNALIADYLKANHVKVFYHRDGYKVHAKVFACRLLKKYGGGTVTHISSGNYTSSTGNIYTDLHYFSNNKDIYSGVMVMKNALINSEYDLGKPMVGNHRSSIYFSPIDIKNAFLDNIRYVISQADGTKKKTRIWLKCNHLYEPEIVSALEEATRIGVDVRIICRTTYQYTSQPHMNRLNIRRIVGNMLEHDRLYIFGIDDIDFCYMGSADILSRKLSKRVEILASVADEAEAKSYFLKKWQDSMPFYI